MPFKPLILAVAFLLYTLHLSAQMMPITHFSGTVMYGSRAITTTSGGSVSTIVASCLGTAATYHVGSGAMGYYQYAISAPVYTILIEAHGLNAGPSGGGESLYMDVNGSSYPLTPADIVSYSNCGSSGASPGYLLGGTFYGPLGTFSWTHYNGGIIKVSLCTGITSFAIYCNGIGMGGAYNLSFDSIPPPGCLLTASNNGSLCEDDTLRLFALGSSSDPFYWTGPSGFTSTLQNPVIPHATISNAGTYTVTQTIGGTTHTAITTVIINPAPSVTAAGNSPLCEGDDLLLTASPPIPGGTFTWSGPAGFFSTLQNPVRNNVVPPHAGTYSVIAQVGSCRDTATVSVIIKPKPALSIATNSPVCEGSDLLFTATPVLPGETFSWTGPSGFTSTLVSPSVSAAATSASGTYTTIATVDGCSATILTNVVVKPLPIVTANANNPVCVGSTLQLSATPSIYDSYSWSGPNTFSGTNPTKGNVSLTDAGTYILIAGLDGCYDTAEVTVIVIPSPVVTATGNNAVCEGNDIILAAGPGGTGKVFTWTGPNSFHSTLQNPVITAANIYNTGSYFVTVTQDGCSGTDTISITVISLAQHFSDSLVCLEKPFEIELKAYLPNGATAIWSTGETKPAIFVKDTGSYTVTVRYDNCLATGTVNIRGEVCDCDLVLPNAFSPNSDGLNDYYRPVIPNTCIITAYTFAVYNRWGQEVFFTRNTSDKWDGNVFEQRGEMGTYMYYLIYVGGARGKSKMLKGDVTLIR